MSSTDQEEAKIIQITVVNRNREVDDIKRKVYLSNKNSYKFFSELLDNIAKKNMITVCELLDVSQNLENIIENDIENLTTGLQNGL
ncbi:hypothetical protein [Methanococcoides burtonii]|uniref:Uncharacterized protein n=1 Tax=Methanococcoides burtonii (strain DSM 6242 / NBRC 107633 / OCM 468 / ACE-M) TaxID=259564 RepID=Q12Y64_METBU|nr:hypothetical protein [Methanococcoides burtonii]ABE51612.1 Hypothetical protein Mbur_0641 [Methanococcoides burtonii DSM 6242]